MPSSTWLELIRFQENLTHYDRAVGEYERLAEAFPQEKQAILALISAGRLCLKNLHRPQHALKFYKAAASSTVPHAEWESKIQAGFESAELTRAQP